MENGAFKMMFPEGQDFDEQEKRQDEGRAQPGRQGACLQMTGRTGAIGAKALFRVKKMDK